MGFQIRNKDGEALAINVLDQEACDFWEQPVDKEMYACPKGGYGNWFDTIGYKIHNPIDPNYTKGWNSVKHELILLHCGSMYKHIGNLEQLKTKIEVINDYLLPYFQLIDHWEAKGYTPHKVQD